MICALRLINIYCGKKGVKTYEGEKKGKKKKVKIKCLHNMYFQFSKGRVRPHAEQSRTLLPLRVMTLQ